MSKLNTPILYSINAFDPTKSYTFRFNYSGNQAVANRAIITNNDTQEVIYNVRQGGFAMTHILPANILSVGKSYTIQIQVYDTYENYSNLSDAVLFYCYTTPQFFFNNIENIITSANYELELVYSQNESELLKEYRYYLYDATKTQIYDSGSYYTDANLKHTLYGLQNNSIYYVRAIGVTKHGMSLDTGMIQLTIRYNVFESNMAFDVINDAKTGCIILRSNILTVGYETENDNYKLENGELTLFDNTLTYDIGGVDGDFCLIVKAKQLPLGDFLWTTDKTISLAIECIAGNYYCNLRVRTKCENYDIFVPIVEATLVDSNQNKLVDSEGNYIIVVDPDNYNTSAMIIFEVYRKNNIYDIRASYE